MKPAITAQQEKFSGEGGSRLAAYRRYAVGSRGLPYFAYYECCTALVGNLPGLLGFGSRSFLYPALFKSCGKGVAFGKGLVLRNVAEVVLGNKVLIDDFVTLDARDESSIAIGDYVSLGRFSIVAAKGGMISLGAGVNIGTHCRIATNSKIDIGESVLIAAYCYIGPGNHRQDGEDTPLIASSMEIKGGVTIGAHSWIGARATILDGVSIGRNAVVGAHSLVRENVPDGAVVAGCPARIIKTL